MGGLAKLIGARGSNARGTATPNGKRGPTPDEAGLVPRGGALNELTVMAPAGFPNVASVRAAMSLLIARRFASDRWDLECVGHR